MITSFPGAPIRVVRSAASLAVDALFFLAAAGLVSGAACSGSKSCGSSSAAPLPVIQGPTVAGRP